MTVPKSMESHSPSSSSSFLSEFQDAVQRTQMTAEVRAWAGLGIGALALAGVFALLLAISRVPGIESTFPWPIGFFEKGLVIHVVFSFVVWFLAVFGALACAVTALATAGGQLKLAALGRPSIILAYAGSLLMAVPGFLDRGEASLNNYVPVIIDPLYYAGLLAFTAALVLVIIRFAANFSYRRQMAGPFIEAVAAGCIIFIAALACFVLAYVPRMADVVDARFNEDVFWGGGHALQYLNTTLMLSGWYVLCHITMDKPPVPRGLLRLVLRLCVLPVIIMPLLYVMFDPESGDLRQFFTDLQYLLAPPVVVMGVALGVMFRNRPAGDRLPWEDIGFQCLFLSLMTFAIGGYLGLFVDGTDTRTPAHYHAVIAAVNLVFMGLFLRFLLPIAGRPVAMGRAARVLVWLYAVGQMVASVGLFLAGGYGAPRKTAGDAQGLEDVGAIAGLYMNGVGAAIAVIGGIMFIWICARALLRRQSGSMNKP